MTPSMLTPDMNVLFTLIQQESHDLHKVGYTAKGRRAHALRKWSDNCQKGPVSCQEICVPLRKKGGFLVTILHYIICHPVAMHGHISNEKI